MQEKRRGRCWAFVVYPDDSLPENYLSIIESWHIPTLISPCHDKDLNADETEKKKHKHILLNFDGNKSYEQLEHYSKQLNGTFPILVDNNNGMIRYFIHIDNPEKHQYSMNELVSISGFDYSTAFDNKANDIKMMALFESYVNDYNVTNFYVLIQLLKSKKEIDLLNWIQLHCNTYIKFYISQKYLYFKSKGEIDENVSI